MHTKHTKGGGGLINSIVKRHGRLDPYNDAQINIIRSAAKLFLQNGFSGTTLKMIEKDSGVKVGNITYYFRSKEDLLAILVEEIMDFHANLLDDICEATDNPLFSYAMEITAQLAICEENRNAWDLYYNSYNLPHTFEHIKTWGAEKNYNLFKERLPGYTEQDFRDKEVVAAGIELAAMKTLCDRNFTIEKKITLILDALMMLYEVKSEERQEIIARVLATDYCKIGCDMFEKFVKRLDNDVEKQK